MSYQLLTYTYNQPAFIWILDHKAFSVHLLMVSSLQCQIIFVSFLYNTRPFFVALKPGPKSWIQSYSIGLNHTAPPRVAIHNDAMRLPTRFWLQPLALKISTHEVITILDPYISVFLWPCLPSHRINCTANQFYYSNGINLPLFSYPRHLAFSSCAVLPENTCEEGRCGEYGKKWTRLWRQAGGWRHDCAENAHSGNEDVGDEWITPIGLDGVGEAILWSLQWRCMRSSGVAAILLDEY